MLLKFRAENFRSIRDAIELNLGASNLSELPDIPIKHPGSQQGVLPVVAFYGANASGKTNVLRALHFMSRAVADSQTRWQPEQPIARTPFAFDEESRQKPSVFEVIVAIDGSTYQYGFELDDVRILREWLFAFPKVKRQTLFERESDDFRFGKYLTGENRTIQSLTRANSLFLSAAAQNNHRILTPLFQWFAQQLDFVAGDRRTLMDLSARAIKDEKYQRLIALVLKQADLGFEALDFEEMDPESSLGTLGKAIQALPEEQKRPLIDAQKTLKVFMKHRMRNEGMVRLPLEEESQGTVALFGLLGPLFGALIGNRVLCVDELDSSLHPILAKFLIQLFYLATPNGRGQLIFNTHDTNLLDANILRRDQIWFVEKNELGATVIYPLTDFKPRKGENLEAGYLHGRYGAIPFVSNVTPGSLDELRSEK